MLPMGFLGGTGVEAKGLALRFAAAGAPVILGSRSTVRAAQAAAECNSILGRALICGKDNREMLAASRLIFLTVPYSQAVEAVESCRSLLNQAHTIIDVTVPLVYRDGCAEYLDQNGLSNSEIIASHLPQGVLLVAAFKTIPAAILANLEIALNCDLLVCSDSEEAAQKVMEAASWIPSLRPIIAGPLRTARTLERMTVLAVELNRRYRKKGARYRIEGI